MASQLSKTWGDFSLRRSPGISMPTHSSVRPSMHQHSWGAHKVKISLTEGAARNFALNNSCLLSFYRMLSHTCVDQSRSNELLKQVVCDRASILIMSWQFPQGFDVPHPVLEHLWWYLYKVSFHICPAKSCKVSLESKHKRIFKALSKTICAMKYISDPHPPNLRQSQNSKTIHAMKYISDPPNLRQSQNKALESYVGRARGLSSVSQSDPGWGLRRRQTISLGKTVSPKLLLAVGYSCLLNTCLSGHSPLLLNYSRWNQLKS